MLLLAVVALAAMLNQAEAQEVTFVDNTYLTGDSISYTNELSQRFNTGSNTHGYKLTKVRVEYNDDEGDKFSVKICTVTGADQPTSTCTNFTAPAGSFSPGEIEFTHSTGMDLAQNTKYAVVITPESGKHVRLDLTISNSERGLSGWNIAGELRELSGGTWEAEPSSRSLGIHLKGTVNPPPNTPPTASPVDVWMDEDTTHTFTATDIGFMDDDPGDTLDSVRIAMLPSRGSLRLDGAAVIANQVVTKADIDGGKLTFAPDPDENARPYTILWFYVSDGTDESSSVRGMRIYVRAVNDAPTVSPAPRVTAHENTAHTFSASDFNFMDVDGDTLASVKITTLEDLGDLELNGTDVAENQVIGRADIDAGKLTFTPAPGASGSPYATFGFKVNDGTVESALAYAMTIDVTSTPAQGAVPGALVSNTGQSLNGNLLVGDDGINSPVRLAQQFSTGPDGYVLTHVVAALGPVRSGAVPRVSIYSDSSGEPGTSLHVLSNPSSFIDGGNNTFTAQGKPILLANTNYWVVFDNDAAGSGDPTLYFVTVTRSRFEDPGAERGWSIANAASRAQPTVWSSDSQVRRIAIQGRVAGNDANLSGLALFDAADGSTIADGSSKLFDAVRFRPGRTEYHAIVDRHRIRNVNDRLGAEITVAPTLSDSRARIVIRERDGSLSVDANPVRPGHQVMLTADGYAGVHKFRVWVTAEDGRTRKSYTVSLRRELRALRVGIHQTPNSTVEQGNDVEFEIRVTDPDPGDDVNLAAIGGSVKFRVSIVCEKRNPGNHRDIRNRKAECRDLTLLGTRGGDSHGFSQILTISDSALEKRTNAGTGVETGTMTLTVGTEPDTIHDDGGNENQNFQENFAVRLGLLHERDGGPSSFLKFTTSEYHWFTLGSIRLAGHLGDECEHLPEDTTTGCAIPASDHQVVEPQEAEPLTAAFQGVPVSHDGSSAFTLRLAFSEDVEIAPEDLRDHVLSATGGTVTGVTRVDAAKDLFELTVEPAGDGAVTVTLVPPPGGCEAEGAVCTAAGTLLSSVLAATVVKGGTESPGNPDGFTASYSNAPAGHGGATFTYEMAFSEDVAGLSFRTLKFGGIQAENGTVRRAKRHPPGVNRHWTIHIVPDDGNEDVVVTLPATADCAAAGAVCDSEGKMLTSGYSFTVPRNAPVSMSVADVTANESDGSLDFVVSIAPTSVDDIAFRAFTRAGTATADVDFTPVDATFTIEAGDSSTTVSVPIAVDAIDDGGETVGLLLDQGSTPDYVSFSKAIATGTINNDGPIPQAWTARFGRTVADQVLDAVDARLRAARAPGVEATVAGQALSFDTTAEDAEARAEREEEARTEALGAWLRGEDGEADRAALSGTRTLSERELFTGTSFALTGESAEGGTVSAWGRGVISNFDGREGDLALDGEVGNLMLGADFVRGRATAGLMLSHARGSGGYRGASAGHIEASLTGLYPFGRYEASDRLSVWGVAGYGEGTLTVEPEDQAALETDMGLAMASVGVRSILMKAPPEGGAELAVTSDAMAVRTTSEAASGDTGNLAASEADVTRLRLGLEGSRAFRIEGGASLTPSVEFGVRHDGGDAETGFGADIGAGLAWSDPARGLSGDVRARGLLTHEDGSFHERGFAGSLAWDPAPGSARGPSLSLTQTVGAQASGGVEALLGPQTAQALEAANENDANELERRALEAKLGYGFALFEGRYTGTPELGLTMTDSSRETVLGWRIAEEARGGLAFGLDVEAARQESAHGEGAAGHRLGLGFGWRFQDAGAQAFEVRFEGSRIEAANDGSGAGAEHRMGVTLTARW